MSGDVVQRGHRGVLFRNPTMDFNAIWLLGNASQGGASVGALLDTFARIRNGRPRSWVQAFTGLAEAQAAHAATAADHAAVAVAWRAALTMLDPRSTAADAATRRMVAAHRRFLALSRNPMEPWSIPFGTATLPAYVTPGFNRADRLLVIIGGGDTYAEDLWFLGAREAVARGWAVLTVDLPGQGDTPRQGLHFGQATMDGFAAVLDQVHRAGFTGRVALLGWSGGGIFTVRQAALARREDGISAVVASTPVHDAAGVFEHAMPTLLRGRGPWLMRAAMAFARRDRVLRAAIDKYDWQFGPGGVASAVDLAHSLGATRLAELDAPVLALVGADEDRQLRTQAHEVVAAVRKRHPASRVVEFPGWSGGSAHCQVGNIGLAMQTTCDWLDALGLG